ncbi:MAG TPA: ABC transporter ATP-binding protein [Streptosporangiaceae bacterium]|nr:ABC transporter ATP-binding protein [Streptosporangiaceae bacterium]
MTASVTGAGAAAVATESLGRVYHPQGRGRRRQTPVTALHDLTLMVDRGEVHGLLGPNGAGKSTLMKLLSTILLPSSGSARVCGYDVVSQTAAVRRTIAIVFGGDRGLYPRLTGRQNLSYWAALYQLDHRMARRRVDDLLDRFQLRDRADKRVETYSTGMRQRLHLARGLISSPRLLLLDEPTNGLDPVAAAELRGTIREVAADGRTVLMATHDMAEAEAVCERVTLINHGALVLTDSTRNLGTRVLRCERIEVVGASEVLLQRVRNLPGVTSVTASSPETALIEVSSGGAVGPVLHDLVDAGVASVRTTPPSLEDVYLRLVGGRVG